jgi:outer membrane protein
MLGVDIAHRTVDQYRLASSPVATLFANYGNQLDAGSIASSAGRDITRSASIGVQLSIPLWDGGSRSSLLRQAIAQEDQQAALLEATRRDAERLAMNYFNNIRDGVLRIASLDRARASGENSVNSNRIGREAGVRTTIDVLNAEQTYYQTLYSLSAARYDLMFNRLQLAAMVGALNETMLGEVNSSIAKP